MSDLPFDEIVDLALQLAPVEQLRLMERLAAAVSESLTSNTVAENPRTQAEIEALIKIEPMTGAEIVAAGLLGGWADEGIQDGAEWVNEQKRKRKELYLSPV